MGVKWKEKPTKRCLSKALVRQMLPEQLQGGTDFLNLWNSSSGMGSFFQKVVFHLLFYKAVLHPWIQCFDLPSTTLEIFIWSWTCRKCHKVRSVSHHTLKSWFQTLQNTAEIPHQCPEESVFGTKRDVRIIRQVIHNGRLKALYNVR